MTIAPDVDIVEETRFRLSRGQLILTVVMIVSLFTFGLSTVITSRQSISQAKILSQAESPASSIIFTQRETLVYVARFTEWLAGGVDRRTVQIARALLAQRLNVIDADGTQVGSRLNPEFLQSLRSSDEILASASPGLLPANERESYRNRAKPIIDSIVSSARELIESYQHAVDTQIRQQVDTRERGARINLALLLWLIAINLVLFFWVGFTTRRQYRRGRQAIRNENRLLSNTREELIGTQKSLMKLESLNTAKNEFISTINHELRTPLTSIIGYIGLMRSRITKGAPVEELSPFIERLDRNALGLLDLVEGALSISRLDAAENPIPFEKLDLAVNIENVLFVLQPSYLEKRLTIDFAAAKESFIIDGDNGQISQVFMNLLSNAIKFSPVGSEIKIELHRQIGGSGTPIIRVNVIDQGIGIPSAEIPQLFSRFFRAQNAISEQIPGTGLGLAIVQKIVLLHGGVISVQSELGTGTDIEIRFPEAISPADALVSARRNYVLSRSLERVKAASPSTLAGIAHEIGGAIGFYTFVDEGKRILEISRDLERKLDVSESDFQSGLTEIKGLLEEALHRVESEER